MATIPKQIVITIDLETAESSVEAVGFQGRGCEAATAPFEDAMGARRVRRMKPEAMQQTAKGTVRQTQRGGR